ncbi:YciI family protein [Salinimicrobium xinjiangense]|uniref:YciI family protein n=1 Tax=Salinimicrobium xinjiangense TaxID=438596 RepID=UPI0004206425|nr:YciI family protein [Salinimicrobium xinjiangense]
MKNAVFLIGVIVLMASCNQSRDTRGIPGPDEVEVRQPDTVPPTLEQRAEDLEEQGFQTFVYEEQGEKHLMQQYYIVFLKAGENRSQDSATAARLQQQHMAHLNRMATDGYLSLAGPFADDGDIRGIAVYHTPTQEMADSLARLDPMVQAGRLEVEIHPWWAAKGSKLE